MDKDSDIYTNGSDTAYELNKVKEKYTKILEGIEEGYFEVDLTGTMRFCNDSLCTILGYSREEFLSMSNKQFTDEVNAKKTFIKFNEVFKTGVPIKTFEWEAIRKDGSIASLSTSVSLIYDEHNAPEGFRGIVRDISEKKHLEAQLRQSQKMEAIGTLAGGIAHDFNNILAAIMGYSELATFDIENPKTVSDCLSQIKKASLRAKDMVKQILTFSRQTAIEKRPVRLRDIIETTTNLMKSTLPSTIVLNTHINTSSDIIIADTAQIEQVLLNLGTNASHAVDKQGGIITVSLNYVDDYADEPTTETTHDLCLSVSDNGHGIPEGIVPKIFDPYFSTKEKSKGTGLGLAMVQGIMAAHNAEITVESTPGEGSVFKLFFSSANTPVPGPRSQTKAPLPGRGHILFVDDEDMLKDIGHQMLEKLDYSVLSFTSPGKALDAFKANANTFDAVISDMTMPEMTGDVLLEQIKKIRPDIPVVICTGYSESLTKELAIDIGASELLYKPIEIAELAELLKTILSKETVTKGPGIHG